MPGPSRTSCEWTRVAPTSKIRSTSQYDAAAELITLKQWDRAIGVLEDFRRDYPKSELSADVTRKLAVAYTEANRPGEAATEFERIAASPTEDRAVQREALLQSADLYAKANNTPKAVTMLEKFVSTNPTPVADAEEARQRLADYAGKSGDAGRRTTGIGRSSRPTPRPARNAPTERTSWPRRRNSPWRSRHAMRFVA